MFHGGLSTLVIVCKNKWKLRQFRWTNCSFDFFPDEISIFISEAHDSILDIFGGVANEEHSGGEVEVADGKLVMFFMFVPKFSDEAGVIWGGNGAPLI